MNCFRGVVMSAMSCKFFSCQQAFLQLFVLFEFVCHVLHVVFLELDEFFFFHLNDPVDDCLVDSFFEP